MTACVCVCMCVCVCVCVCVYIDMVADVWDFSRVKGGWFPVFSRDFNDWEMEDVERLLHFLHIRKIRPYQVYI